MDQDSQHVSVESGFYAMKCVFQQLRNLIETDIRQRGIGNPNPVKLGRCFDFLNNWYGFIQGTNQYSFTKVLCSSEKHNPKNQTELAELYGITQQTMNNYMRIASMIFDLQDENSKLRALISNNFGRRKNDPAKDRKALETYVSLRGYKQGGNGSNQYKQKDHNGLFAKATLDEIAKELNMSTTNLKRALRIERNLTDSMKELLDTGEITKTFAFNHKVCKEFLM